VASDAVNRLFGSVSKALRPPELLSYSDWAMENFRLAGNTAAKGRFRPWKFQRGILDAIGDPLIERVTVIKSARTGFTVSLVAAIGAAAANDPGPIILLMPTDDDARGIVVDEIDPAFRESPALRSLMQTGRFDGRNTLTQRAMLGGGTLKVISARAPRNLRRHTTRFLFCDEVDGMEVTKEGDPIVLAEKRTISYPDRKIVIGSTPTDEATSIVLVKYGESDQRIFEIPCMQCGDLFELLWENIDWTPGKPKTAVCVCPSCGNPIEEKHKPEMVEAGEWRATAPEIERHAGFRMNALISQFSNVSWANLVEEFEKAEKAGPAAMQVFVNTNLGKVWSTTISYVSQSQLLARAEDWGIQWSNEDGCWREDIPQDVAYITAGVDVQVDRFEITFIGHSASERFILGHHVVWGGTNLDTTWEELHSVLTTTWRHPLGGQIGISASAIDSGDGGRTQFVYDYCERTQGLKIVAIKGREGPIKVIEASKTRRRNRTAPLYIVGVDQVKTDILVTLPLERGKSQCFRFSNTLSEEWFRQVTSERRVVKIKKGNSAKAGRPEVVFERISGRKAEALDTVVYGLAVKYLVKFDFETRYAELKGKPVERVSFRDLGKRLNR
jgi:phage terminase large subunit GpA-like protein